MKDKKLDALIKKAAKQATSEKGRRERFNDPTLAATRPKAQDSDEDVKHLFKEMKRREF